MHIATYIYIHWLLAIVYSIGTSKLLLVKICVITVSGIEYQLDQEANLEIPSDIDMSNDVISYSTYIRNEWI